MSGLIHLYFGKGKGKSTASIGLALRAASSGMRVLVVQFMKDGSSSEVKQLATLDNVEVLVQDSPVKFSFEMTDDEKKQQTQDNNALLAQAIKKAENYDFLLLDEVVNAYSLGLLDKEALHHALKTKRDTLEMVITGRKPSQKLIDYADYATEMVCHKHPFKRGIAARRGIEF